ncbi:MAG: T9SS type A sorting domain-containing protein [Bacteroidales bacterium]|jgi:hypothetical protein|nr:T9SS type A sorting domain-containing protein [Bacteroidales bacterium]
MKNIILFIAFTGLVLSINAQNTLKLKTIETNYGKMDGSSFYRIGKLDGAIINVDTLSVLIPVLSVVNISNDTFSSDVRCEITIDFLLYDDRDSLLADRERAVSRREPLSPYQDFFPNNIIVDFGFMSFPLLEMIDALKEEENIDLEQISYWKIISGVSYTSKDGTYSDNVFYEGADTSIFYVVRGNVGIQEIEQNSNVFSVYPNPTNGQLRIMNYGLQNENIEIFDIAGKMVKTYNSPINNTIDISELQTGMYFITTYSKGQKITKKFVKQ